MDNKKLSTVDQLLAMTRLPAPTKKWVPSEEQKLQWMEQEPSEAQCEALLSLGVSQSQIDDLSKFDASELIETLKVARDAARKLPGSMSPGQEGGLIKWGFTPDQLSELKLSWNDASEALERLGAQAKAARAAKG